MRDICQPIEVDKQEGGGWERDENPLCSHLQFSPIFVDVCLPITFYVFHFLILLNFLSLFCLRC